MRKDPFALLRFFTSLIFIYAGTNHLFQSEKIFGKISKTSSYGFIQNPGLFQVFILISGLIMFLAGIALMLNYKSRLAAGILLLILIPITISVQLDDLKDLGPFFKNIAIAGSLLFILKYKSNEFKTSPGPEPGLH